MILGKTTMPDYGMLSSGLSSFHPLTRNPWDLSKNPGGSSAGAGAAAAAGYGPLHVGTDIGGSVRLPAGWCGIFTLKPSLGRIPIDPPYAGRVAGPMTRTVADAALLMSVLSQPDERDTHEPAAAAHRVDEARARRARPAHRPAARRRLRPAGRSGGEATRCRRRPSASPRAGAHVERIAPFFTRAMLDGMDAFWRMRSWLDCRRLPRERQAKVLPFIVEWAKGGAHLAASRCSAATARWARCATPPSRRTGPSTSCCRRRRRSRPSPPSSPRPTDDPQRPLEHIAFTVAYNMSEQPAASINCGCTSGGLPIGLQIAGKRHDDLGVLQVARAWEQLRPTPRPWPEPPAA